MKISGSRFVSIGVLLIGLIAASCAVIDLRGIDADFSIENDGEIINDDDGLAIVFSLSMNRQSVERAVALSTDNGSVEVDFFWDADDHLRIVPVRELVQSRRHKLSLKGTVRASDGREFSLSKQVFFYFLSDAAPLLLLSYPPLESVSGVEDSLEFHFSLPVETEFFERNFSINPHHELLYNADGNQITATPKTRWQNLTRYTWTIGDELRSAEATPIVREYRGSFHVGTDVVAPQVVGISRVHFSPEDGEISPLPGDLADLGFRDAVLVTFSKPMDPVTVLQAWSVQPSIDGTLFLPAENQLLFHPELGWDMRTEYAFHLRTSLQDASGNPLQAAWRATVTPSIDPIEVELRQIGVSLPLVATDGWNTEIPVNFIPDGPPPPFDYRFVVVFSQPIPVAMRPSYEDGIRFTSFFPALAAPTVDYTAWAANNRELDIFTSDWEPTPVGEWPHYYLLTISGDVATRLPETGSYIPEELTVFLIPEAPP